MQRSGKVAPAGMVHHDAVSSLEESDSKHNASVNFQLPLGADEDTPVDGVAAKYVSRLVSPQAAGLAQPSMNAAQFEHAHEIIREKVANDLGLPRRSSAVKLTGVRKCCFNSRLAARRLVQHRWFDRIIILLILTNMVLVATWDPLDKDLMSPHNRLLDNFDIFFQVVFTLEMFIKIYALGLIRKHDAYLRDSWNVVDCLLVVSGWLSFAPAGGSNLSIGRLVRVLRPLRTINHVPGLRMIINSLLASIPQLMNVIGLCAFIFFMFGIVGIQLFSGKLNQRCHFPATATTAAVLNEDDDRLCSLTTATGRQCPVWNGVQTVCIQTDESVNFGITNFDNIGNAFLTIFQIITLEGWVDIMYWMTDAFSGWFAVYFVAMVTFGSMFVLNLVVAVITLNLSAERTSHDVKVKAERWQELARIPEARMVLGAQNFNTADLITQLVAKTYLAKAEAAEVERERIREERRKAKSQANPSAFAVEVTEDELKKSQPEAEKPKRARDVDRRLTVTPTSSAHTFQDSFRLSRDRVSADRTSPAWQRSVDSDSEGEGPPIASLQQGHAVAQRRLSAAKAAGQLPPLHHKPKSMPEPVQQQLELKQALALAEAGDTKGAMHAIRLAYSQMEITTALDDHDDGECGTPPGSDAKAAAPLGSLHTAGSDLVLGSSSLRRRAQAPPALRTAASLGVGSRGGGDADDTELAAQQERAREAMLRTPAHIPSVTGSVPAAGASARPSDASGNSDESEGLSRFMGRHSIVERRSSQQVVRFTDTHGKELPNRRQRTSIVESVARGKEGAQALVQMRLPASRRFGPFPYSPAWRWITWRIVSHRAFEWIILVLIMVNTVVLALEHHDMDPDFQLALQTINLVLTVAFGLEMLLKIAGLGLEGYVDDWFNTFDGVLVAINLVELSIQDGSGDASGVSALRSFRLMRVFKLMRQWRSLNDIITNILKSLPRIGPFTVVLLLFMVIYALIGMQLFGGTFGSLEAGDLPRTNYDTLLWSFVTTFQILTGENWNEVMYWAVTRTSPWSVVYFVSLVILGSYIVLNLFLGILIDNFRQDDEDDGPDLEEKIVQQAKQEIIDRIAAETGDDVGDGDIERQLSNGMAMYLAGGHATTVVMRKTLARLASQKRIQDDEEKLKQKRYEDHESYGHSSLYVFPPGNPLRVALGRLVVTWGFETVILLLITGSCVLLALDTQTASDSLRAFIGTADLVLTILFCVELAMKVVAYGFVRHKGAYLRDGWNILDALIVVLSIMALLVSDEEVRVLKVVRFCRALRPLRVVKRLSGLRLVVNSVVKALPHCFHVAMLSLMLFMMFGILGVNFFGGRLLRCSDPSRKCLPRLAPDCPPELACTGQWYPGGGNATTGGTAVAREWVNPTYGGVSSYSFDSSIAAVLTLFEVANLELWHEVMWGAADITRLGWAPERNANEYSVFYFIAFVVMASFFMLNLFVSVVVDNFNRLKHAALASPFLTPGQRKWIEMQERITRRRPLRLATPPSVPWRARVFHIIIMKQFELAVMGLIMLNVIIMAMRVRGQGPEWEFALDVANVVFGLLFVAEAVLKIIGLGFRQYWRSGWNRFDLAVVVINVGTFVASTSLQNLDVDFTLLRAVRVVRLFRLVKTSARLRTIFTTLFLSLPSLANVGALLLLLFFMYAIAGMTLFDSVPNGVFISEHAHFRDFVTSMLLLLRMSTGESWNGVMHDCMQELPSAVVYLYFCSFMVLGQFMMLNLFVAVILENFEREMEAEADDNEIKPQDLDAFAALWAKLTVKQGTREPAWLPAEKLAEILLTLKPPLGLHTHHRASRSRLMKAIRVLDIPINKQGKIHYSQTLRALVRRVCGEELPTDMDESSLENQHASLRNLAPQMSSYSTSQLFAAKFVQLWVRSVYARRHAMEGEHRGRLVLTAQQARHLKDQDAFGKQDPYVVFWVEPEVRIDPLRKPRGKRLGQGGPYHGHTDTLHKGGTDCVWTGTEGRQGRVEVRFDAPVVGPGAMAVWAEAWDEDLGSADDLIGMATIPIFAAMAKGKDRVTVPLHDQIGAGGCGELTVLVQWIPDADDTTVTSFAPVDPQLSEVAMAHIHEDGERFAQELEEEQTSRRAGNSGSALGSSRRGSAAASEGSAADENV